MPSAALKTAIGDYGHTQPLKDGTVKSSKLELEHISVSPIVNAFRRMVRGLEFDISEMAITTYICARAFHKPFTAIPVFPVRAFHHRGIVYNTKSGIKSPADIAGRRVGVNRGYTVTGGLWARGVLQTEYGVDLNSITWVLSGDEHVAEFQPPPNVVSVPEGKELADMLVGGEIDAAIGLGNIDNPDIQPLIPDAGKAAIESFKKTGVFPINHTVVIKNELLAAEPWIAEELFGAFRAAKKLYLDKLASGGDLSPQDQTVLETGKNVGGDPLPYGIEANRKALETVVQFSVDQKIISQKVSVEELFTANAVAFQ